MKRRGAEVGRFHKSAAFTDLGKLMTGGDADKRGKRERSP